MVAGLVKGQGFIIPGSGFIRGFCKRCEDGYLYMCSHDYGG